jgi:hypothetical protein
MKPSRFGICTFAKICAFMTALSLARPAPPCGEQCRPIQKPVAGG